MTKLLRSISMALAVCLCFLPLNGETAPESFSKLARDVMPAVVNISTSQTSSNRPNMPQAFPPGSPFEDMFKDFFDRFGGPGMGNRQAPQRRVQSLGSGFIISDDGYVVTNNHVIESADEIEVIMQDGTTHDATLVGRDPKTDVALLKIDSDSPLPFVRFGESDTLEVGDWVLAVGNPFGLGGSVSAGIVSARHRRLNAGPYDDFIQTDAAINKGNSGGPLFDMDGFVVGVNTAIISPTGGSVGIGFSIPSNMAKSVVSQLREFGSTRRGWLGVRIQIVSEDIADSVGLKDARGALVAAVSEDGPSARSDIRVGDIILTFDGRPIDEMQDLPRIVAETEVGKTVKVELWRDGRKVVQDVEIALLDETNMVASNQSPDSSPVQTVLGMSLTSLTPEIRGRFGIEETVQGVLIVSVDPNSQAAQKGVEAGHVIDKVLSMQVRKPSDVLEAVEQLKQNGGSTMLLRLNVGGQYRFVALRIRE